MKKGTKLLFDERYRSLLVSLIVFSLIGFTFYIVRTTQAGDDKFNKTKTQNLNPIDDPNLPSEFDTRAIHGTPRGTEIFQPTAAQLKAIDSLANVLGLASSNLLNIKYNGLTATPRHIHVSGGFLTEPSSAPPELIAREFIRDWKGIFRFTESDLNNLKLTSRATHPDTGTTTLLFSQQLNGINYFNGGVLVNVAKNGQIMNVGGESFPDMNTSNAAGATLTGADAVGIAAEDLGFPGFTPVSLGSANVLVTFGNLKQEYVVGERFSNGNVFGDDIIVSQVIFPQGDVGRLAYKFILTTPQHYGIMWMNIVDATTGTILRRSSRTAFQKLDKKTNTSNFGPPGGGVGVGRQPTMRPDLQDFVENMNNPGTATGKTFDTMPTLLSGSSGFGRSTRVGTNPTNYAYQSPKYAVETETNASLGRGFKYSMVVGRYELGLPFPDTSGLNPTIPFTHAQLPGLLGQITRGFPDATNPSTGSPFGWFYLPTDTGGVEITSANGNRDTTRANGYSMDAGAVTRNQVNSANSPTGNGLQPFSADVTPLGATANLRDGRSLSSVFESRYTEGNAVLVADDRNNDNEATHGIKGYSSNRQYTAPYFDFYAGYEYGGVDAASGTAIPPSANPDVFPATVALFYFNNVLHDYLYEIGFTEQFWNFQMDNFGLGGAGGDSVSVQAQDGSGTNNANFGTPDDGSNPRMQMFVFTEGTFRRSNGDFDFDVVAHELYHGVSNRSAAKGSGDCLGITLVGESGGMGEGWGDFIGASMADDDAAGEFVTGEYDIGIRRLSEANYRWSYGAIDQTVRNRRDQQPGDAAPGSIPFQVHATGELWSATLWDMRELLIMKNPAGIFYDGSCGVNPGGYCRLGSGTSFYIGNRLVQSVDTQHPVNYRASFGTSSGSTPTMNGAEHNFRPGVLAAEINSLGNRNGPLATAVSEGGRLADKLVLRGLQLTPCNPSFVDMRDSILLADSEMTGGENRAIIWRAFASHGIGVLANSSGGANDPGGGTQSAPTVVEDFSVPAGVTECETLGPLGTPTFNLTNTVANQVDISITTQANAQQYVISRSTSPNGPFATIATVDATPVTTTFSDDDGGQGLNLGQTFYYQVRAARNPECVGSPTTNNITVTVGVPVITAPVFFGVGAVTDTRASTALTISWSPATSSNPNANIVYDVFRVESITTVNGQNDSTTPATFTPSVANRIAQGLTGLAIEDQGLTLGQIYYYIVQARDTNNGTVDTNNVGNTVAKFAAPTSNTVNSTPFPGEDFESASANARFTPPLVDSATLNVQTAVWQRVPGVDFLVGDSLVQSTVMYAPEFDPPGNNTGGQSDFSTVIGPLPITSASVMEFNQRFVTEAAFDGGVIEIAVGSPSFPTVFPDNVTNFDINYFAFENGYTGPLDGTLAGPVILSALQGRFSFDGTKATHLTRIALGEFAPGGEFNPTSQDVYIRFRMTSDAATTPGAGTGWFIDNLVINDYLSAPLGFEADLTPRPVGNGIIDATDVTQVRRFQVGLDPYDNNENELQRADSAPYNAGGNSGDGAVTAPDVVQTRRFQIGLDPKQTAGGPTSFGQTGNSERAIDGDRRVRVAQDKWDSPKQVAVSIFVDAEGDEAGYGFTLNYDKDSLENPAIQIGTVGGNVLTNTKVDGKIGFSVDFEGNTIEAGKGQKLVTVIFEVNPKAQSGKTKLTFGDSLAIRSAANPEARLLNISFENGTAAIGMSSSKNSNENQIKGRDISLPEIKLW